MYIFPSPFPIHPLLKLTFPPPLDTIAIFKLPNIAI
uniref:Uncharacterized protein n=1 Tax=Tetranychus urticae TaxID=32264 RepID=T1JYN9_TETUR